MNQKYEKPSIEYISLIATEKVLSEPQETLPGEWGTQSSPW